MVTEKFKMQSRKTMKLFHSLSKNAKLLLLTAWPDFFLFMNIIKRYKISNVKTKIFWDNCYVQMRENFDLSEKKIGW